MTDWLNILGGRGTKRRSPNDELKRRFLATTQSPQPSTKPSAPTHGDDPVREAAMNFVRQMRINAR